MMKVVPNGGWGWAVVFGSALANMLNQSLVSLFSLMFGEELERMGHGTTGVALVMNINSMVTNFSGLGTGWVLRRFTPRCVALTGVAFTTLGLITAGFATNIVQLILSYSVLTGLGLGLIMPSSFMVVNSYFTTRRFHAVGIAMAGTGIGQMMLPHVVQYLLDNFGYRGTTLIMGALSLHGLVGAILFQPVEWHMKKPHRKSEANEKSALLAHIHAQGPPELLPPTKKGTDSTRDVSVQTTPTPTLCDRIAKNLGLHMLSDIVFVHIIIGLALTYTCSIAFTMLYPFYLQAGRGLTRAQTATCMSVLSAADIVARLTVPFVCGRLRVTSRQTFLGGALLIALARIVLVLQTEFTYILLVSALCGYIRAATVINQNLTISEYVQQRDLASSLGLNMVIKGFMVLTVGQFFGWIRDFTGSFDQCIYIQSAVIMLMVCSWSIEMLIKSR